MFNLTQRISDTNLDTLVYLPTSGGCEGGCVVVYSYAMHCITSSMHIASQNSYMSINLHERHAGVAHHGHPVKILRQEASRL